MMIQIPSLSRRNLAAAPRYLKRVALFSGGALVGGVVSAVASYTMVSNLYPAASISAAHVAALPPAPVLRDRATMVPHAPGASAPITPREGAPVPAAAEIVLASAAPVRLVPGQGPVGGAEARRGANLALAEPGESPETLAQPVAFDIALPNLRPQPRPITEAPALTDTVATLRPRPRPDTVLLAAGLTERADPGSEIPGIRPAPRPDNIVLAGATAPSTDRRTTTRRGGGFTGSCGSDLAQAMPRRPSGAATGQAFFASLGGVSGSDRDTRVINEIARGNLPAFLRELQPVTFRGKDSRGNDTEIVICVTPDYLALGSDRDYVRVPLGLPAAARIAKSFDMTLPTPRMVDAIYAQADVRLSPAPMTPGPQMSSTNYFLRHNATIEDQLRGRGGLVAGQKKDVVIASRMASKPGRVAIYGWHRSSGSPIQPVSTVHGANYADYSHGIRLVSKTAFLNGRAVALDELLASRQYASLLNKDGPLPAPVIRIASR